MNSRRQSGMAKAEALLVAAAIAIFLWGALRYARAGNFTLKQALFCLLFVPVAFLLLLLLDFTVHHARIVAVMVIFIIVLLTLVHPAFCVGMALLLAGMVVKQHR